MKSYSHVARIARQVFVWTFILAGTARAQVTGFLQNTDSSPPRRVELATPSVTVPMILQSGHPMVEVRINGRGPFRMLVETGARRSDLSPSTAEALGLIPRGSANSPRKFMVDSVTVGGLMLGGVPMSTVPLPMRDVDGVLGLPAYSTLLVTLDYPAREVRFERGSLPPANGRDVLPMTRVYDFWGIPFTIAGRKFEGILDTQSGGALSFGPRYKDSVALDGPTTVIGKASGVGFSGTDVEGGRLTNDMMIGQYTFTKPGVAFIPFPPTLPGRPNIGSVILQNFVVTIDQKNKRIRLAREGSTTIELPTRRVGASPVATVNASPLRLADYIGTYGSRTITLENGKLYLQRVEGARRGPSIELAPAGADQFNMLPVAGMPDMNVGGVLLTFTRDSTGRVAALQLRNSEGIVETLERTQA